MKISYLSSSPIEQTAANSIHVMQMSAALASHGHDVVLHASGTFSSDSKVYENFGVPRSFKIIAVQKPPLKYLGPIFYGFQQAVHAYKMVKPDMCYARCITSAYFAAKLGLSFVLELHEMPYSRSSKYLYDQLLSHQRLKRLVVISNGLLEDLTLLFPKVQELDVVIAHDGANFLETLPQSTESTKKRLRVGYAGGLREGNGISLIISLAKANPDIEFHMVGGSTQEVNIWKSFDKLENLNWRGSLQPCEVSSFLLSNDILIAPYQEGAKTNGGKDTSRWMSPLKIFEYMAAGKPMLISDFPVLREILDDECCIFNQPEDFVGWQQSLTKLVNNSSLREAYGQAAKTRLKDQYTWQARAEKVMANF
jgi:glycosyltransferase involved in cell wall biosynthesis